MTKSQDNIPRLWKAMSFFLLIRDNLHFATCKFLPGDAVFSVDIKMDAFPDKLLFNGEGGQGDNFSFL